MIDPGGPARPFLERPQDAESVLRHLMTGVLPLKFAYTGSGAHAHDRFAGSKGYRVTVGSAPLEMQVLQAELALTDPAGQLVEIGPGNGKRTAAVLAAMSALGREWHRYLAIDVSATLLGMACEAVQAAAPAMAVAQDTWDIESGPSDTVDIWRRGDRPLTACLFGHTLGNMESAVGALHNVRRSLRRGDHLAAGLTLRPRPGHDSLDPYRTDDFRAAVLEPLVAAGIPAEHLDFELDYVDAAIVGTATLRGRIDVRGMSVPAGHRFRCFRSRRFTVDEVSQMFETAGWQIADRRVDVTGDHLVVTAAQREGM